jgi:hypothetical protein
MTIRKLDRKEWKNCFDRISQEIDAREAEIEVVSLALGEQIDAEWLPLLGITYDPKDNILEVALDGSTTSSTIHVRFMWMNRPTVSPALKSSMPMAPVRSRNSGRC